MSHRFIGAIRLVLAQLAIVAAGISATVVNAAQPVPNEIVPVTDSIAMLVGRGGNVAVSYGRDGVFLVDDQYQEQYDEIISAVKQLSPQPVRLLVNTHWHSDHAGSNAQMSDAGVVIVAHENVRQRLSRDQVLEFFNMDSPAPAKQALPLITFASDVSFHVNDQEIAVFHVNNAHTDGDSVVHFRNANVIHTGDVFFHRRYPFIDAGNGGSISGMRAAVRRILELADDNTKIIPGHGALTDKKGLEAYLEMLDAAHHGIATAMVSGQTVEQIVAAKPLAAYDFVWGTGFINSDTFVRMLFDSISRETLP